MKKSLIRSSAIAVSAAIVPAALAGGYVEGVDAGNTKALATLVSSYAAGEVISGTVTGTSTDIDYYHVVTATNAVKNIYLHNLAVTAAPGVSITTRGRQWNGPSAAPGGATVALADVQMLSGRANGDSIKWYGFGNNDGQYLRVAKSTSGAGTYSLTHTITTVTVQNTASTTVGTHSLATRYLGDGEIFLYDSNFNLVGQNDNQTSYSASGNTAEIKFANLALGTYFVAVGNGNTSSSNPGVTTAGSAFLEASIAAGSTWGGIQDDANTLARPSNVSQSVSAGGTDFSLYIDGVRVSQTTTVQGQEVAWYQINVVPTPGTLALVGMGGLIVGRRRR